MGDTLHLITLSMIVKNEEALLPGCLKSVKEFVDEIIIVDTGSTDRTVEIAHSLGAQVEHFDWIADFSAARNAALGFVKTPWTLWLDADDLVINPEGLRGMCHEAHKERYNALWTIYEQDSASQQRRMSLFKTKDYQWKGVVHESPIIKPGKEEAGGLTSVRIKHRKPKERGPEAARNYLDILLEKDPDNWIGIAQSYRFLAGKPDDPARQVEYLDAAESSYHKAFHWEHTSPDARYLCIFEQSHLMLDRQTLRGQQEQTTRYYELAQRWAEIGIHERPDRAECWVIQGQLFEMKKAYVMARECYNIALNCALPGGLGLVFPAYYDLLPKEFLKRLDEKQAVAT